MSQIVKTDDGFGIEVPVCAGIKDTVGQPTSELKDGQIVVTKYPSQPSDAGYNQFGDNAPTFIKDPEGNVKSLNKIFPVVGKNVNIKRSGAGSSENTLIGGFTVNQNGFNGGNDSTLGSQVIKNFTADTVKVILESGSYGDTTKMNNIQNAVAGQIFLLVQA